MNVRFKMLWLGLATCYLCGCSPKESSQPQSETTRQQVAELAAAPKLDAPAGEGQTTSQSIDELAEGREYRQAIRAIDAGNMQAAETTRARLAAHPEYSPLAGGISAYMELKKGNLDAAMRTAEELSTIPAMQTETYVIAGEVFQRQNRLPEALGALNSALDANPAHLRANLLLGAIYFDTGAMRLATSHLRKVAELDPHDVNALMLSAKIHADYEQYQEALLDLQRVLARELSAPQRSMAELKSAECLLELRKLEEAKLALTKLPDLPPVGALKAAIAEAEGDFDSALQRAEQVLEQAPDNRTAGLVQARIFVTSRKWEQALQRLAGMVESYPYDHEVRLLFGRALVGSGEKERGQQEITRATRIKDAFLKFADLHHEATRNPEDTQVRVELGKLAEELGKVELALTWYRAALGLDPSHQEARAATDRLQALPSSPSVNQSN